jgi:hypothetical protein
MNEEQHIDALPVLPTFAPHYDTDEKGRGLHATARACGEDISPLLFHIERLARSRHPSTLTYVADILNASIEDGDNCRLSRVLCEPFADVLNRAIENPDAFRVAAEEEARAALSEAVAGLTGSTPGLSRLELWTRAARAQKDAARAAAAALAKPAATGPVFESRADFLRRIGSKSAPAESTSPYDAQPETEPEKVERQNPVPILAECLERHYAQHPAEYRRRINAALFGKDSNGKTVQLVEDDVFRGFLWKLRCDSAAAGWSWPEDDNWSPAQARAAFQVERSRAYARWQDETGKHRKALQDFLITLSPADGWRIIGSSRNPLDWETLASVAAHLEIPAEKAEEVATSLRGWWFQQTKK